MNGADQHLLYAFNGFRLDPVRRQLMSAKGQPLTLTSRVFNTLMYLVEHRGGLVDKDTLMHAVWPDTVVEENNLNQAITTLRKALGEKPSEHRFIVTEPGRGYRFVAEVKTLGREPIPEAAAEYSAPQTQQVIPAQQPHARRTPFPLYVLVVVLVVLTVGYLYFNQHEILVEPINKQEQAVSFSSPVTSDKFVTAVGAPLQSVAVLPFADMSPNKDQEYFADGVAEEILNQLSRIRDLFVAGRTSSFSFKGKEDDLRIISEKLNVSHILEGSIRKEDNRVRVSAQLVKAADGYHLWSKNYDRTLNDIFAIQDDIAKSVADALEITLGVGELGRIPGMTRNIAAYDAYLAGRSLYHQIGRENMSRAIEQLEQAVTLDPDFAVAWSTLTTFYSYAATAWIPDRAEEFITKRETAASRAMALAPESEGSLTAAALIQGQRRNLMAEEQSLKKALVLVSADSQANVLYGFFLMNVGLPREAIGYFRRAARVEPLDALAHSGLGNAYELNGNRAAAVTSMLQARELSNQPVFMNANLMVLAMEEDNRARIKEYATLIKNTDLIPANINNGETRDPGQDITSLFDTPEEAIAQIKQFLTDPAYNDPFTLSGNAVWASYFGDHALALKIYKEASKFSSFVPFLIWRPIHKDMRRLPRFKDLVRDLKLVDYWRATGNWGDFCRPLGDNDFECE